MRAERSDGTDILPNTDFTVKIKKEKGQPFDRNIEGYRAVSKQDRVRLQVVK